VLTKEVEKSRRSSRLVAQKIHTLQPGSARGQFGHPENWSTGSGSNRL